MTTPKLTNPQRNRLVNLLCDCGAVADSSTRDVIVGQLRDAIRHGIQRHAAVKVDVSNIVQRCLNFAGGLEELVQAVYQFEDSSLPMQKLLEWLEAELQLRIALDEADNPAVPARDAAGRGARGDSPAPQDTPVGPVRNRWALLVGINRYTEPAYADLRYCVNDVRALEQQLAASGYTVICMHDELNVLDRRFPNRDNVEAELQRICDSAEHDDLVLVFFACHGLLRDGRRWLTMQNTREGVPRTALELAEVEAYLRASKANRRIMLLDACHVGIDAGRSLTDPAFIRNTFELAEGFAVLSASTSQQIAQEWRDVEQGVFSYYLLEGLSGAADRSNKGFVTVDDLKNHVIDGLRRWNVQHGMPLQEPNARIEGIGDIIVVDRRRAAGGGRSAAGARHIAPNPFGRRGRIDRPEEFFDREELLRVIFEELGKGSSLALIGEREIGKSSLLATVARQGPQQMGLPPEAFIEINMQLIRNDEQFYRLLCKKIGIELCYGIDLYLAIEGKRFIICLDEIEKMHNQSFSHDARDELRGLADGAGAPFTLVIASGTALDRLFPDEDGRTSPLYNICAALPITPFPPQVARAFLQSRLQGSGITFSNAEIDDIVQRSAGHPARLQEYAAELYRSRANGEA